MGNRELLAMVLALQEWQHWLQCATQPFVVWMDHKNLAYLRSSNRLNTRQARWALFLGRFKVILTYRPSSKNTKPDALSHQFASDHSEQGNILILSPSCIMGTATRPVEEKVLQALSSAHNIVGAPPNSNLCQNQSSTGLGWPVVGLHRTLYLLRQHFWWPSLSVGLRTPADD